MRAKTVIGVLCLQRYCDELGESHSEIDKFCEHFLALAKAKDIKDWIESDRHLTLDGLGSPIPESIAHIPNINDIACHIREITESQLCCAYNARGAVEDLKKAAELCHVDLRSEVNLWLFLKGSLFRSEWADPVRDELYDRWISTGLSRKSSN
ncbi:MAG TPA: hypothetical protein VG796_25460 [Verrucomicrobiales bacterium]|nr:hypothetical protein [Verrucomicrobiales bacterium]